MKNQSTKATKSETVSKTVSPAAQPAKMEMPKFPMKFAVKRETLIKTGIVLLVILIAIPVFDWIIQTSISAKYAAFYKDTDITRDEYVKALEDQYGTTVMQRLLVHSVVINAAKEKGTVVSEAAVTAAIDAKKKGAQITTEDQFKAALLTVDPNLTPKVYFQSIEVSMTLEKMLGSTIKDPTEAEVKAYFDKNQAAQYPGKKYADIKATVAADAKADALSTAENDWVTAELKNYDGKNILVDPANEAYKFMRSIDLVQRLFSGNPNTK